MTVFLLITLIFSFLQLTLAFFLIIMSIHGPDSLPVFTLSWLILIQIILWYGFTIFRKNNTRHASVFLFFLGLIMTATGPLLYFISEKYDKYKHDDILANTKIYDVRDELLLAENGKPFGIRLSFKAEFPRTEYIYITPLLRPTTDPSGRKPDPNDMRILRYSTQPPLRDKYYFRKGITYHIEFDMVPQYLIRQQKDVSGKNQMNFCLQYPIENINNLSTEEFEQIITTDAPDHYLVMIHGTTYGDINSGNKAAFTIYKYNPLDFYKTYSYMNIDKCNFPRSK